MDMESIRKSFLPSPQVLLMFLLIGALLLGAVLYYRAVKIQRFLEPTLAVSEPGLMFSESFRKIAEREFRGIEQGVVEINTNSVRIRYSHLVQHGENMWEQSEIKAASKVFLTLLRDPAMKPYVDFILIGVKSPISGDSATDEAARSAMRERASAALSAMYRAAPELEKDFGMHFTSAAFSSEITEEESDWLEMHIIPSERIHIDMLLRLEHYAR